MDSKSFTYSYSKAKARECRLECGKSTYLGITGVTPSFLDWLNLNSKLTNLKTHSVNNLFVQWNLSPNEYNST